MTDIVSTVSPNQDQGSPSNPGVGPGQFYATLSAWENGEQTNLVTDGDTHTVECYEFSGGLSETGIYINGWTTDASGYVTVQAAASAPNNGLPETGFYLTTPTFGACLNVAQAYTKIIGVGVSSTTFNNAALVIGFLDGVDFEGCVFKSTNTSSDKAILQHQLPLLMESQPERLLSQHLSPLHLYYLALVCLVL